MIFDSRSHPHGSPSLDGATIRHPKSRDWEPCAKCGERLEFGTNGMGKLVPECPVCDWGWKPRHGEWLRDRKRMEDDAMRQSVEEYKAATARAYQRLGERVCVYCHTSFQPLNDAAAFCSTKCKDRAGGEKKKALRVRAPRYCMRCETFEILGHANKRYCDECAVVVQKAAKLAHQRKKRRGMAA